MRIIVGSSCATEYPEFEGCQALFGSVVRSIYTFFQVLTLESWSMVVARPVLEVNPGLVLVFVLFLFLTTFGLLNIIVGVIVENTLQAAKQNLELQQKRQMAQMRIELEMLRTLFEALYLSGSRLWCKRSPDRDIGTGF